MNHSELEHIAKAMVAQGKGILAADESSGTIKKRFDKIALESTADSRRAYRDMLFTTPGMQDHISGVILYDETLRQSSLAGVPFAKHLTDLGVVPGIKVDTGLEQLPGTDGETATQGLDGLGARCAAYYKQVRLVGERRRDHPPPPLRRGGGGIERSLSHQNKII